MENETALNGDFVSMNGQIGNLQIISFFFRLMIELMNSITFQYKSSHL